MKHTSTYTCSIITQHSDTNTEIIFGGLCDLYSNNILTFNNIEGLINLCISNKIRRVYIHDFNYFCSYLYYYLLNNNIEYSNNGRMEQYSFRNPLNRIAYSDFVNSDGDTYMIKIIYNDGEIKHFVEFRSSKNKTRNKLCDLVHSFDIDISEVTDIDINCIDDHTIQLNDTDILTDDIKEICLTSAFALARILKILVDDGNTELTLTSDAVKRWIKLDAPNLGLFPALDLELDVKFRHAYCGGLIFNNPDMMYRHLGHGFIADISGLYPYVMRNFPMPFGQPEEADDLDIDFIYDECGDPVDVNIDYSKYWIAHVVIDATVKNKKIPCILNKPCDEDDPEAVIPSAARPVLYSYDTWITCFDLKCLYTNYNVTNISYIEAYTFKTRSGLFNKYIDHYDDIKRNSKGARREIAKLMLDSLYGRFGIKRDNFVYKPEINNNKINYTKHDADDHISKICYLPISLFITSIGRMIITTYANSCDYDKLAHVDTDCLQLLGDDIPDFLKPDFKNELGCMKLEAVFNDVLYCGPKTYIYNSVKVDDIYNTDLSLLDYNNFDVVTKMAGAPAEVQQQVGWHNFLSGGLVDGCICSKQLIGGLVRYNTKYKLVDINYNDEDF